MSSIRGMLKQARPQDDQTTESPAERKGEGRRALKLPSTASPEERKPYSTRVKPSLKRSLENFVKEIQDAGFKVTQEQVLDALLRELQDSDDLRERVAQVVVEESR